VALDPLQVRIARLEGSYEQIDKRMGALEDRMRELHVAMSATRSDLHAEIAATRSDLHAEIATTRTELHSEIRRVGARVDALLYGLVAAILVPICLRVFFH
jgi:chromosome segregation ATPase